MSFETSADIVDRYGAEVTTVNELSENLTGQTRELAAGMAEGEGRQGDHSGLDLGGWRVAFRAV